MSKKLPNILITGTPGCGKTQHCERLKELLSFQFFNCGDIVKEKGCHTGFDEDFQSYIIDEDKLLDELEDPIAQGGCVIDHHSCDFFPERFFQLVVVLRCGQAILHERLGMFFINIINQNVDFVFVGLSILIYDCYHCNLLINPGGTKSNFAHFISHHSFRQFLIHFISPNPHHQRLINKFSHNLANNHNNTIDTNTTPTQLNVVTMSSSLKRI